MKATWLLAALVAVAMGAYALDRGIFVGSERYVFGAPCCPDTDSIVKRCRYLFVTGISEIAAVDGEVSAPRVTRDPEALRVAMQKPENGHCPLFGRVGP